MFPPFSGCFPVCAAMATQLESVVHVTKAAEISSLLSQHYTCDFLRLTVLGKPMDVRSLLMELWDMAGGRWTWRATAIACDSSTTNPIGQYTIVSRGL